MQRFGLLGETLRHSFSPMIHAEFGKYEYKLYEKKPEELDVFFKQGDFDGLNITIPYKKSVIKYCKSLSVTAQAIGSVNTIIRHKDGTLHGDNTDLFGFTYLLERTGVQVADGKTIILGSGGSSLAVQTVLKNKNAREVVVISRSGAENYENINKHNDAILIINTTPVGMYPNNYASPIEDLRIFNKCCTVIDLIYNPLRTELMQQAKTLGIQSVNGLRMLVAQAKGSAEHFLGSGIPDTTIENITTKIEQSTQNIVLIGMPGCGKTTIGKALAKEMNRKFTDTDDTINEKAGKTPAEIISENGEGAFRELETDALRTICKENGLVIATGGGVVTRSLNQNVIKKNGIVIFLDRDLNKLQTKGRPLSKKEGIETLAAQRLPLYNKWCDYTVKSNEISQTMKDLKAIINRSKG